MTDSSEPKDLAAEYVLGTLSQSERDEVAQLRAADDRLDREILRWEQRLAPLAGTMESQTLPSADLYPKIEQQVLAAHSVAARPAPSSRWQARRGLVIALAVILVLGINFTLQDKSLWHVAPAADRSVAVLAQGTSPAMFVVSLNEAKRVLNVRALAATPPDDKSYELWFIAEGDPVPHSLGVLPLNDSKKIALDQADPSVLKAATLAVSVEPVGGSPTGKPTGAVVATAKFTPATL